MTSQQLVDYVREQLKTVSIFLSCSQITENNMHRSNIDFDQIMQESKLSAVCERVFDRCLAPSAGGEGCDNMTMILVQFKKPVDLDASVGEKIQKEQPLSSDQRSETEADRSSVETESK